MPLAAAIPAIVGAVGGAASAATLGAAAIGAGTAIYTAGQQTKAANNAEAAQLAATNAQIKAQQENLDRIQGLQQPFINTGYAGLDALAQEFGLAPQGGAAQPQVTGTAPATGGAPRTTGATGTGSATGGFTGRTNIYGGTTAPTPDYADYLADNPDVGANFEQMMATPEGKAYFESQGVTTPEQAAQLHYEQFGKTEGRDLETIAAPGTRPTYETPAFTRPDQGERPDYGPMPEFGEAPSSADYLDPSKFTTSPGYEFRLNEGNRNLNAKYGARGLLKSGGAIKGFTDYNQGMASDEFARWFDQGMQRLNADRAQFNNDRSANFNIYNTNRSFLDDNFEGDRNNTNANFDTDRAVELTQFNNDRSFEDSNFESDRSRDDVRYDTGIDNLFRLTSLGTGAAAAVGGASTNAANQTAGYLGAQGDARAGAAYDRADASASAAGAIGGAAANIFGRYAPVNNNAPQSDLGTVNLGSLNVNPYRASAGVGAF